MTPEARLTIGFIPLVDAAALLIAVEKGLTAARGLQVELVREASWANVRDKLAIGRFDAAHLLAPMAVSTSLGLGHMHAPLVAPIVIATNGNAITVSKALHGELAAFGDIRHPRDSGRALAALVARRSAEGREPLIFGMTFPFSMHNYQLRYWMAEAGIDPDEDVRLIVVPPPAMAEHLARGLLDGFCVGAPWSSVSVDAGVGVMLHFGSEIFSRGVEKVLAMRAGAVADDPRVAMALIEALVEAAAFVDAPENHDEVARVLARPDRIGVDADIIRRVLQGRLPLSKDGEERSDAQYLVVGGPDDMRPDLRQADWILAQMLRWDQARYTPAMADAARAVWRPDLFDAALDIRPQPWEVGAFAGPNLEDGDLSGYLSQFPIGRRF